MKRKRIQFLVSLLITGFFLYLAFRNVQWRDLWDALRTIQYLWAVPFMAVTILSMWFRTVRWRYLLDPVVKAPSRELFSPLMICFTLNSILPGRAGEFARAYLVARDYRVPFSSTLATVIVERIVDGLGLLALFVVILALVPLFSGVRLEWDAVREIEGARLVLWTSVALAVVAALMLGLAWSIRRATRARPTGNPSDGAAGLFARIRRPRAVIGALLIVAILCVAAIAVLASGVLIEPGRTYLFGRKWEIDTAMLRALSQKLLILCGILLVGSILTLWGPFRRLVQAIIRATPVVPRGVRDGLNRVIEAFVQGFYSLRSPRIVFWVLFHTATVWLTVGWSLCIMSYGFPPAMHLTLVQGMAVSIIICIAILIPAAPGYWGLYEVGCILALQMLGKVPLGAEGQASALSYSLVAHFIQMLPVLFLGLWFLWRRRVGLTELTRGEDLEAS